MASKSQLLPRTCWFWKTRPCLGRKVPDCKLNGKGCWEIRFVSIKEHQLILILDGRQAFLLWRFWLALHTTQEWHGLQIDCFLTYSHFTSCGGPKRTDAPLEGIPDHVPSPIDPSSHSTLTCSVPLVLAHNTYSTNRDGFPTVTQTQLMEQLLEIQPSLLLTQSHGNTQGRPSRSGKEGPAPWTRKEQRHDAEMSCHLQMDVIISFPKTGNGECGEGDAGKNVGREMEQWRCRPPTCNP